MAKKNSASQLKKSSLKEKLSSVQPLLAKKSTKTPLASKSATKLSIKKIKALSVQPLLAKKSTKTPLASKSATKLSIKKIKDKIPSDIRVLRTQFITKPKVNKDLKLTPFLMKQHKRLLNLKDTLLDSMRGVARDNLHTGSETSAFGMHHADAGSDAYDRDFALSMLSKEQGSLYEIDEALKRIEDGTYGVCEICSKPIKYERLEALPFTRYTVDCQSEIEKRQHHNIARPHITSLFGLTEEETESEEEDITEIH